MPNPDTALTARAAETLSPRPQNPKKDTIVVPKISQHLYHPVSKAILKAGEPVPSPEHDATWLIQRHRGVIADFFGVTPEEKEFIGEWDAYILEHNITSSAYFPQTWLGFVQQKAAWLVARDERIREFGKHQCVLFAREELTNSAITQALRYINQARLLRTTDIPDTLLPAEAEQLATASKANYLRKSSNGCTVCQLPVRGPRLLVCANKTCAKRLYHSDCIEPNALVDVTDRTWFCNVCVLRAQQ